MTFLGKCLTAIILIMSGIFMAMALVVNATHRNWRDAAIDPASGLRPKLEALVRENQELRDARQKMRLQLDRELLARRTVIASLQSKLDTKSADLQATQNSNADLTTQVGELIQTNRSRASDLSTLTVDADSLRKELKNERGNVDARLNELAKLSRLHLAVESTNKTLNERNNQLAGDLARYKEVTQKYGINVHDPVDQAPPNLRGKILAVNKKTGLVEISLGYDEGLRKGHQFQVSRGPKYVGKIRIKSTKPDHAVAIVLKDFETVPMRENDDVYTIQ